MKNLMKEALVYQSNQVRIFLCICIVFMGVTLTAQMNYNQHNAYLTNSDVLWLKTKKIDFLNAPVTESKLIASANNALSYRDKERSATAKMAIWGAIGIWGITNLALSYSVDNTNSFNENAFTNIFGVYGIVSGGLSIKYFISKRKNKAIKEQHIEMCQLLSGG